MMVKNIIQEKEWVLQLSLINLKMFYLIKKSKKHKWRTYETDKISLSCFDE